MLSIVWGARIMPRFIVLGVFSFRSLLFPSDVKSHDVRLFQPSFSSKVFFNAFVHLDQKFVIRVAHVVDSDLKISVAV